mmetsp:Transcript_18805/g.55149  ORF Transcript_18805/g.55149 Transcript_18805/m.55149 type:complete len:136 (-) Transcript_18805:44-451(-)
MIPQRACLQCTSVGATPCSSWLPKASRATRCSAYKCTLDGRLSPLTATAHDAGPAFAIFTAAGIWDELLSEAGVMLTQLELEDALSSPRRRPNGCLLTPLQMIAIRHDGGHEDGHRDGHNERNFDEFLVPFIEVL